MRATALLLIVVFLFGAIPAPARAMSTAKEIAQGEQLNRDVDRESVIVTDPFLTSWVNRIGANLSEFRARSDITYRFEIINSNEINSFALPGGFIHVDMGLLNFAASDDELAGVIGHEMGHIERRHIITLNAKANILGIIIGVLSILSPIANLLAGYGGDLAITKLSRQDELQADQYGLLLMSRAGYDPRAVVDLMARLEQMARNGPAESRMDKAFADHPPPKDRIAHLLGYPSLDNPSTEQQLARAIHDENEGLYAYAQARVKDVIDRRPSDKIAQAHVASLQVALTESGPRQIDGGLAAAAAGDPSSMASAAHELAAAANIAHDDSFAAKDQAKSGDPEIETFFNQLESLSSLVPNLGTPGKNAKNLARTVNGMDQLVRDINGVLGDASDALSTGPGLIVDNRSALRDMAGAISGGTLTPKTQALLPYYPFLTAQLEQSSDEVVRGMVRARASVAMGASAVRLLSNFFNSASAMKMDKSGDVAAADWPKVQSDLDAALPVWDGAAAMAATGSDLVYAAQTRQLSARLTLMDLFSSPQRFNAFRRALAFRFPGVAIPEYRSVAEQDVTPGELGCAAWLAFETKQSASQVIARTRASDASCPDLALQQRLPGESMEIAEGLLYSDYVTKPQPLK